MDGQRRERKKIGIRASKECAYLATFVALVIAAQLCLSFLPGIELVTLLFISYSFAFGWKRGMIAATVFSTLRQFIFGFFPNIFLLYLVYYNFLTFLFGCLGSVKPARSLWWLTLLACLCTAFFSLIDCAINFFWFGLTAEGLKGYFLATLAVALPHIGCTAVTVGVLFLPLQTAFRIVKRGLA